MRSASASLKAIANLQAAWWTSPDYFIGMGKSDRRPKAKLPDYEWFVYMLHCADGTIYTGIAKDVSRRCRQHNAGTASRYTRGRLPVEVVYHEGQTSRSLALRREAAIKALSRRQKEAIILLAG